MASSFASHSLLTSRQSANLSFTISNRIIITNTSCHISFDDLCFLSRHNGTPTHGNHQHYELIPESIGIINHQTGFPDHRCCITIWVVFLRYLVGVRKQACLRIERCKCGLKDSMIGHSISAIDGNCCSRT